MSSRKLLSILCSARNDNYYSGYVKRLQYIFNYSLENIKVYNFLEDIDFYIVDWGSKKKLSKDIFVANDKFKSKINFIEVDEVFANKYNKFTSSNFFSELAENIGLEFINSEFTLLQPSDQFFSKQSIFNLVNFLRNKNNNLDKMFMLQRQILPIDFAKKNFSFNFLDYFFENSNFNYKLINSSRIYSAGGMGGFLAKTQIFRNIGGIKNINLVDRGYFSKSDNEILMRSNNMYSYENLSKYGILYNKLPYTKKGLRTKRKINFNYRNDLLSKNLSSQNKFPIKNPECKEEIFKSYNSFSLFSFYKNFLREKNYKLSFKSKLNLFSFFEGQYSIKDSNNLCLLNEIVKKLNIYGIFEFQGYTIKNIYALSRVNPYCSFFKIKNNKEHEKTLNDWLKDVSIFNDVNKSYIKILDNEKKQIELIASELPEQNFLNLIIVNECNIENFDNLFKNIKFKTKLFSMVIIKKSVNNNSHLNNDNLNKNFLKIGSNKEYIFYINKLINSKKFQKTIINVLKNNEKKDLLKDIMNFTIIYLAKLRLIWFKLKKQCLKKFR